MFSDCSRVVERKFSTKLSTDEGMETEMKLLLARAGKYVSNSTNIKASCVFSNSFRGRDNFF